MTYGTIDFAAQLEELQEELERLENGFCVYDYDRAERVNYYNHLTTALLIMREIPAR